MSKRRLLLADDSVTIQKVVNLTFADEGIEVITVGDGDSAMDRISEAIPDVVLADVNMPGLSGYQICELVRENPVTRELPVVLLVGSFEPFDESEAARVGANAYLTKPFQSIRQLVTQVTDLMDVRSAPADQAEQLEQTINETADSAPVEPESAEDDATFDYAMGASQSDAAEPVADTSDIDRLYHQSFTEPSADDLDSGPPRFVDAGMDDEMIETTHSVAEVAESANGFTESESFASPSEETVSYAPPSEEHESFDSPGVAFDELPTEEPEYSEEAYEPTAVTPSPFDSIATHEHEPAPVMETSAEAVEQYPIDQFAATEQIPIDTLDTEEDLKLDDVELLELPPMQHGQNTIEFTIAEAFQDDSGKQVVSLSPELMDQIVQKVVDKLSQKN